MQVQPALSLHGRSIETVFDLLGHQENDLTAALGFTLARSPCLVANVLDAVGVTASHGMTVVRMETSGDAGRTDLELEIGELLVIVEAKRGWRLPSPDQLSRYAARARRHKERSLVTLSDCSPRWASRKLQSEVDGVSVTQLPGRR